MEAIIQRAIATSNDSPAVDVIFTINNFIIRAVKGVMAKNKIDGRFDVTVRNKLSYSPDGGFNLTTTSIIKSGDCEREFISHHKEVIDERSPLYMLRGVMMSQSIKVNMMRTDLTTLEEAKIESGKFIREYLAETMKNNNCLVSIERDVTGKHAIEIELVEIPEYCRVRTYERKFWLRRNQPALR